MVSELLTSGNHPRGIKVRLQSGQVGRVQRMGDGSEATSGSSSKRGEFSSRYTDVRNDLDYPSEPPPRSLADFLPPLSGEVAGVNDLESAQSYVEVKCPFCESFTGDEAAVTHHIDREHLT